MEPAVDIDVEITGRVTALPPDLGSAVDEYVDRMRADLIGFFPAPAEPSASDDAVLNLESNELEESEQAEVANGAKQQEKSFPGAWGIGGAVAQMDLSSFLPSMPNPAEVASGSFSDRLSKISRQVRASLYPQVPSTLDLKATFGTTEIPDGRSEEEYMNEIEEWAHEFRKAWPNAVDEFVGYCMPANEILVRNKTDTFLEDVRVTVHLSGPVRVIGANDSYDVPTLQQLGLPSPPRPWGPRPHVPLGGLQGYIPHVDLPALGQYNPSASWENSGSVDITVEVGDLRPRGTFETADDRAVLVVDRSAGQFVEGTWTMTARGHHRQFTGELSVKTVGSEALGEDLCAWLEEAADN